MQGNIQAIQARTAITRELNSACGVNQTNISTTEVPALQELTDVEREEYAAEQVRLSEDRQKQIAEAQEQDKINAENARLANVEHVRAVNRAILDVLEENDISTSLSKKIITLASKGALPQLTINY